MQALHIIAHSEAQKAISREVLPEACEVCEHYRVCERVLRTASHQKPSTEQKVCKVSEDKKTKE
jgi:hypothetical protein